MSFVLCGDNDDDWIVTFYTEDMIVLYGKSLIVSTQMYLSYIEGSITGGRLMIHSSTRYCMHESGYIDLIIYLLQYS